MQADHIDPVVDPAAGFQGWDVFIMRLFVEESGFRAVCKACHHKITQEQRKAR